MHERTVIIPGIKVIQAILSTDREFVKQLILNTSSGSRQVA
jgi:hypothetical protein